LNLNRQAFITLNAAISQSQTQEMEAHQLQLVVLQSIQSSYTLEQQRSLWDVATFIAAAKVL
jgi:hypothetical protein